MGMLSRMSTIVKGKMNTLMDKAENPAESLDVAYDKQMEMLRNVKRGVVEMVTAKRRLEMQASKVQQNAAKLDGQARQAMAAGRVVCRDDFGFHRDLFVVVQRAGTFERIVFEHHGGVFRDDFKYSSAPRLEMSTCPGEVHREHQTPEENPSMRGSR